MKPWAHLTLAIVCGVMGTTALKATHGFTNLWPIVVVAAGYGGAFRFMTLALRRLKLGVVYAIWSGVGLVLISLIGMMLYSEWLDPIEWFGIGLILAGCVILQAFSTTTVHD